MEQINLHTLVLMVGPSGAGKSTAIGTLFNETEVVSSDKIRAELLGDFQIQTNQDAVWAEVHRRVQQRLLFGQRVVVDATNIRGRDRRVFVNMANQFAVELVYVVVNRPLEEKLATAGWRAEHTGLIEKHDETFNNNLKEIMRGDGVARVIVYGKDDITVVKHVNDSANDHAAWFDRGVMVIGDVHGNYTEFKQMVAEAGEKNLNILFLGDIIDYGDDNLVVFNRVYDLVRKGRARMIWGNHERKMTRWVDANFGRTFKGSVTHGLAKTLAEVYAELNKNPEFEMQFTAKWRMMYSNSRQHWVYNNYLFTHGAATVGMWDKKGHSLTGYHSNMAFFGEVDDKQPNREDGYPNRVYNWVDQIPAEKIVVVGHDPRDKTAAFMVTNSMGGQAIFLDTGSSKDGKLSCIIV